MFDFLQQVDGIRGATPVKFINKEYQRFVFGIGLLGEMVHKFLQVDLEVCDCVLIRLILVDFLFCQGLGEVCDSRICQSF